VGDFEALIGRTLSGTYTVGNRIGKGGMGAIFTATHARLAGKHVAIKVLAPELADNAEVLARFRREAEIASQLGHENIVEVHDFNVVDGMPYMVMELLDGEDLGQRIQARGPMALDGALRIAGQVASALEAAHRASVVHRDLKPPNIFLVRRGGRDDFVKVLDFGVSKVLDSSSIVTRDHALVGTPYYMSPEQADGRVKEIDARTDVFALGAIVWEMLVGRMAFAAPNLSVALYKVLFVDPPDVHLLRPDVPPAVSAVLRRALAKERSQRTPSAAELARELGAALQGGWPAALPAPAPGGTDSVPGGLSGLAPPSRPPTGQPGWSPGSQPAWPPGVPAVAAQPLDVAPARPGVAPWPPPQGVPTPLAPAAGTAPGPLAVGSVAGGGTAPRSRRLGLIAGGVVTAAVLIGGTWALLGHREAPPPPADVHPAPAPAPPPVQPPPAAEVVIAFRIDPADVDAVVDVDGQRVVGKELRLPRSSQAVTVTVQAKGYVTYKERVVLDEDRAIAVVLHRKKSEPAPRPAPPAAVPTPPPIAAPSAPPQTLPAPPAPKPRKTGTVFDDP
jgi:serine/threonine-protein kinase